ncbi:MAG: cation transporter [Oligoflexia bacterium]|nr:cation transporter [Oligoflexia bacterium]
MENLTLKVEGMTCMGCVNNVRKLLAPMNGVQSVEIALEQGKVTIRYEPGKAKLEDFKAAIESAGYDVVG